MWAIRRLKGSKTIDAFELAAKRSEEDLFRPYGRKRRPATPGTPTRDAIKLLGPFFSSPRIVAQDAAFTYHSNPWRPLGDYAGVLFRGEDLDISALYRWEIPLHFKGTVVAELSGLGITHRMLFPDLDGIARSIWETEVLWGK